MLVNLVEIIIIITTVTANRRRKVQQRRSSNKVEPKAYKKHTKSGFQMTVGKQYQIIYSGQSLQV